jgi:hypothetical protein
MQILTILIRDRINFPLCAGETNAGHALLRDAKDFIEDQAE